MSDRRLVGLKEACPILLSEVGVIPFLASSSSFHVHPGLCFPGTNIIGYKQLAYPALSYLGIL